jgi:hypothetical protein
MATVFRLARPGDARCCICGSRVREEPVELFVFWPGEEDPVREFAHGRCLAERTRISREPAREENA